MRIKQSDNKILWYVVDSDDKIVKVCHCKDKAMKILKDLTVGEICGK